MYINRLTATSNELPLASASVETVNENQPRTGVQKIYNPSWIALRGEPRRLAAVSDRHYTGQTDQSDLDQRANADSSIVCVHA